MEQGRKRKEIYVGNPLNRIRLESMQMIRCEVNFAQGSRIAHQTATPEPLNIWNGRSVVVDKQIQKYPQRMQVLDVAMLRSHDAVVVYYNQS